MLGYLKAKTISTGMRISRPLVRPAKRAYSRYKKRALKVAYNGWAIANEEKCFVGDTDEHENFISIVVPAFNPRHDDFLDMVYSVVNQHHERWQLVIVNASTDPVSHHQIQEAAKIDSRIKIVEPNGNQGIAGNTNIGIDQCDGEYIAFFDHDDLLHPCALHSFNSVINGTKAELIYSDEDKVTADGNFYYDAFFKPGWSPDLFMNVNYINHLTLVKAKLVKRVNGLRTECNGAQDYDLLLRVIDECSPKIVHIPRVLYHWRAAATSTAANFQTKSYVLDAGVKALDDHLSRININGRANAITGMPGFYELSFAPPDSLTIVIGPIATQNQRIAATWLKELCGNLPESIPVQVVVDSSLKDLVTDVEKITYKFVDNMNSRMDFLKLITGDVVVGFKSAAVPAGPDALARLIGRSLARDTVVVPLLANSMGSIVDAGLVEAKHGKQMLFREAKLGESTEYGYTSWVRNVAGTNFGIFAAPTHVAKELFGMCEDWPSDKTLEQYSAEHKDTLCISDAHSLFIHRGELSDIPLSSQEYMNPQLIQAMPPTIAVRMDDWGVQKEASEKDND